MNCAFDDNLSMTRSGNTYYCMQDGLGSVRTIVDTSENTQNTYDYRAFGINHGNSEGVTSPYRFTAREFETGGVLNLHYYRNRCYAPSLGIFTSRDAFKYGVQRDWSYVRNLPSMLIDPMGTSIHDVAGHLPGQDGFTSGPSDAEQRARDRECDNCMWKLQRCRDKCDDGFDWCIIRGTLVCTILAAKFLSPPKGLWDKDDTKLWTPSEGMKRGIVFSACMMAYAAACRKARNGCYENCDEQYNDCIAEALDY